MSNNSMLETGAASEVLKVVSATFFASLFCMAKREHFWNKKKCFLFHFENYFSSGDNQILIFQTFKYHGITKHLSMKHETHFTEYIGK